MESLTILQMALEHQILNIERQCHTTSLNLWNRIIRQTVSIQMRDQIEFCLKHIGIVGIKSCLFVFRTLNCSTCNWWINSIFPFFTSIIGWGWPVLLFSLIWYPEPWVRSIYNNNFRVSKHKINFPNEINNSN